MKTFSQVKAQVRSLLGDPRGDWTSDAYIEPMIGLMYGAILLNMKNATSLNLQKIVYLQNVPPGTTSLKKFQTAADDNDAPLAGLTDPLDIWVKPTGQPASYYRQAARQTTLPHYDPNAITGNLSLVDLYWNWVGNQINMTGAGQPIDIEVTGRFNAPPLEDPDAELAGHEDIWIAVSFQSASICGVERTNPALLEGYATRGTAAEDNIIADLIRQKQGDPKRFLKLARSTGRNTWFWGRS